MTNLIQVGEIKQTIMLVKSIDSAKKMELNVKRSGKFCSRPFYNGIILYREVGKMGKKFYTVLLFSCFISFVCVGKLFQLKALKQSGVAYVTQARNLKTNEVESFQVRYIVEDSTYQISNLSTGEVHETSKKSTVKTSLRLPLPNNQGSLLLRKSLPWSSVTLTMVSSGLYQPVPYSSKIVKGADIKDVSQDIEEDATLKSVSLSSNDINNITRRFGQWLKESSYGKDAMVVNGGFNDISYDKNFQSGHVYMITAETSDASIFTRISGLYDDGDISQKQDSVVFYDQTGQTISQSEFIRLKDNYAVSLLGVDLSSNKISDLNSRSVFRLYHLPSGQSNLIDLKTEKEAVISELVPVEERYNKTNYSGYGYLYDSVIDTSKPSYQILLATNGKVYINSHYSLKSSEESYDEAPSDMQEKYQELLEEYSKY